jgi:hypothetical protein
MGIEDLARKQSVMALFGAAAPNDLETLILRAFSPLIGILMYIRVPRARVSRKLAAAEQEG